MFCLTINKKGKETMDELFFIQNLLKKARVYESVKEEVHRLMGEECVVFKDKYINDMQYDIVIKHAANDKNINIFKKRIMNANCNIQQVEEITNELLGLKQKKE